MAQAHDGDAVFAPDGLSIVFDSNRNASQGFELFAATRPNLQASFSAPQPIAALNSMAEDVRPAYARDGKTLCFSTNRTNGQYDIMCSAISGGNFGAPSSLNINTAAHEATPVFGGNGLTLYFQSDRMPSAGLDIWRSTRKSMNDAWGTPAPVTELNSANEEYAQWVSNDDCVIYMIRNGIGNDNVLVAKRP